MFRDVVNNILDRDESPNSTLLPQILQEDRGLSINLLESGA
jgi:hypothetical protein